MSKTPASAAGGAMPASGHTQSRRYFLGVLAAAPALAVPAVAMAASVDDPIFALIAEWRATEHAWLAAVEDQFRIEDQVRNRGGKVGADRELDRYIAAADVAADARWEAANMVYKTVPQTKEGALALIEVFRREHDGCTFEEEPTEMMLDSISAWLKRGVADV
ncbi:hypothetical protein SAMN05519103_04549 [Rhizobiales bacterium GAS113]|nr:hypothetical protein SAMN05519103_04549 [Rhizobiales bacterium GAS113]